MNKQEYTPHSEILDVSKRWSGRARKLIAALPHGSNILELYWWHWSNHGKKKYRGFEAAPAYVGLGTYEEIRRALLVAGFPDLSDRMFSPRGFCSQCCPKTLLEKALTEWKQASKKRKNMLRIELIGCDCDGH